LPQPWGGRATLRSTLKLVPIGDHQGPPEPLNHRPRPYGSPGLLPDFPAEGDTYSRRLIGPHTHQPKRKGTGEAKKQRRNRRGGRGVEMGGDPCGRPRCPWVPPCKSASGSSPARATTRVPLHPTPPPPLRIPPPIALSLHQEFCFHLLRLMPLPAD
jgi:hypothetical protein